MKYAPAANGNHSPANLSSKKPALSFCGNIKEQACHLNYAVMMIRFCFLWQEIDNSQAVRSSRHVNAFCRVATKQKHDGSASI
jgi:hypothetical protein